MQSSDTEGISNQAASRRPLPNRGYVSLTEAATWIVEDDCRDDDYLIEQERCRWLLPYLNLLRQGRTPEASDEQEFADAQHWLTKTDYDPEAAYKEISAIFARDPLIETAYAQFYTRLWGECSLDQIVLSGIEYREGNCISAKRADIPSNFFLDPIFHWRGQGPHYKGELGPDLLDSREDIIHGTHALVDRDDVIDGTDPRPTYVKVRIKREDVLNLGGVLRADGSKRASVKRPQGAPAAKREAAKAAIRARWPHGVPPELSNVAVQAQVREDLATCGGLTVSDRTIDHARNDLEADPQK